MKSNTILFFSIIVLFLSSASRSIFSQVIDMGENFAWSKVFITNRPLNVSVQSGSPYINSSWQLANIVTLEDKSEIRQVPVRIDVKYKLIEIRHEEKVKVLHNSNTYSIEIVMNGEKFLTNKALGVKEPEGFYKVIYSKKSSLLCFYTAKIVEAAYSPVLDAGIKDDKIVVEQTYYIFQNGKLTKLENSRKKLLQQFENQPEIAQYIKDQRIMPKAEVDLVKLIYFIDSHT